MRSRGRQILLVVLLIAVSVSGVFGYRTLEDRRLRELLNEAKLDIADGRYHTAIERLDDLRRKRPQWPEVLFTLGVAEKGRGRSDLAEAAWRDVPITSSVGAGAAIQRSRLAMSQGKFSEAESLLKGALDQGTEPKAEARRELILLLRFQGRSTEIRRLYEETLDDPKTTLYQGFEALQELWKLDHDPFPVDAVRRYLDEVGGPDPEDGRVRLALAALQTRAGRLDDADRLLSRCEAERPRDEGIARGRLEWARVAERPDRALAAVDRIKGDQAEADELSAWFARLAGDRDAESKALRARLENVPADLPALDRLAELAAIEHETAEAAKLRSLKDRRDRELNAYKALVFSEQPVEHGEEIAILARSLKIAPGSRFWSRVDPSNPQSVRNGSPLRAELTTLLQKPAANQPRPATAADPQLRGRTITFEDIAERAGLAVVFDQGRTETRRLPETMSGGVALIDYDNDGRFDVFALQGGSFPTGETTAGGDRLFRNKHDGTFEDVSQTSGIADLPRGYSHGVAVGDIDNDGHPDLFITRWRSYLLLRNNGNGTFQDVTQAYGLDGDRDWPTSAAFADLDLDGDLDLYVCHYLAWNLDDPKVCNDPDTKTNFYCTPVDFPAKSDHLFRNDGGRFVDVTELAGVQEDQGRGLGVIAADLDQDGLADLYVANDMSANYLFHNLGGMKFEEVGREWGLATNGFGGSQAGMGLACGDLDGDLLPDLIVTNFFGESSTLHQNLGKGFFADHTAVSGLANLSRDLLGFGIAIDDLDNDGFLDVITANGHVNDGRPKYPWMMPVQVLRGGPKGKLQDATEPAGLPFRVGHLGRGLASGDLDNDGRIDALVVAQGEPMLVLHNTTKVEGNRFLTLKLAGAGSVGAKVTVRAGKKVWKAQKVGGGSYQSANDDRLHFGLEGVSTLDSVEIEWPSKTVDRFGKVETNRAYLATEGASRLEPLKGFKE